MAPQNDRPPSRLLVLATVSFYMFAAIAMVLANKWVLMKTSIPVFFLLVQLAIAVVLLAITKVTGLFNISLELNLDTAKALIPMVAINVLGLNFNNMTLKYVDASMYQVARGLLLPITVAISGVILHTRPSARILLSCAVVTVGFFIGVLIDNPSAVMSAVGAGDKAAADDTTALPTTGGAGKGPSFIGIMFGVLSSCTTALHAVVIKRSLDAVKGNTLQLAWYSNLLSALVMLPLVVIAGEVPGVLALLFGTAAPGDGKSMSSFATFIWGSALTGFVGFLICIAGFLSIKITSPITHMVSAAVRGVLQTLLSVAFFADVITVGRASSISTILVGSIYYTWVKNDETNTAAKKNYTPLPTSAIRDGDNEHVVKADGLGSPHGHVTDRGEGYELGEVKPNGNGHYSPKLNGNGSLPGTRRD